MKTHIVISALISIALLAGVNIAQAQPLPPSANHQLWQQFLEQNSSPYQTDQPAPSRQRHNRQMQPNCQGPQCGPVNRGHSRNRQQFAPQSPMMQQGCPMQGQRQGRNQRMTNRGCDSMVPNAMQGWFGPRSNRQRANGCQSPQRGPANKGHSRNRQPQQFTPQCPMMQQGCPMQGPPQGRNQRMMNRYH